MSGAHVSPMIARFCKRGHLRTAATTFVRKSRCNGKLYIVRECRICHAMRNNRAPSWSKFRSKAKYSAVRGEQQ